MAARMMGHHGLMSHVLTNAAVNILDTDDNGVLNGNEAFGMFRNYGGGRYGFVNWIRSLADIFQKRAFFFSNK